MSFAPFGYAVWYPVYHLAPNFLGIMSRADTEGASGPKALATDAVAARTTMVFMLLVF